MMNHAFIYAPFPNNATKSKIQNTKFNRPNRLGNMSICFRYFNTITCQNIKECWNESLVNLYHLNTGKKELSFSDHMLRYMSRMAV